MKLQSIFDLVFHEASQLALTQWAILVFGVAEVLLARANSIWLFPTGIVATLLSVFVLLETKLFAESALNVYYLGMSIYGWWRWTQRKDQPFLKITFANVDELIITGCIAFGGCVFLYFILKEFTTSNVPVWDAWVSSTAWAGMWLLAKRKVENWILLNLSNAFAIPLLYQKGLFLFALLTVFLFIVACVGYVDWVRTTRKETIVRRE